MEIIKYGKILTLKKNNFVIEIETFDQKENGGSGITYTLYPYPNGLEEDYDIHNTESFDTLEEAICKANKILEDKGDENANT